MVPNHIHLMLQLLTLLPLSRSLSALMVLHLTQLPASVLMVHRLSHSMLQLLTLLPLNSNLSVLTGLDQTQPPASVLMVPNHNHLITAPDVTTAEQQACLSDGTAPDAATGLCADGSQSQSFNATAPDVTTADRSLSVLTVLDLTQPPASVLMVPNHNLVVQ